MRSRAAAAAARRGLDERTGECGGWRACDDGDDGGGGALGGDGGGDGGGTAAA